MVRDDPPQGGTYGVVRTRGVYAFLIRVATHSRYDHAFLVMPDASVIEAEPRGARRRAVSEYAGYPTLYSTDALTGAQRAAVCAKAETLLGTPYGWTDIARLGLRTLGLRWAWLTRRADQEHAMICSQLVAACGQAAGVDWTCGRDCPAAVTPADLARRLCAPTVSRA